MLRARAGLTALAAAAALAAPACAPAQRGDGQTPVASRVLGAVRTEQIREASGIAVLAGQPGVVWVVNDSGNDPVLYALGLDGALRSAYPVPGARNLDWEALSPAPCGDQYGQADTAWRCLLIGDVGDNAERRDRVQVYRVRVPAPGATALEPPEWIELRYEDGPRDVEAMWGGPDGSVNFLTKRPREARASLAYRVEPAAWTAGDVVHAALVDSATAIVPVAGDPSTLVTDAALGPVRADGTRRLAVRTYRWLYEFSADAATGRFLGAPGATARCDMLPTREPQGEAVTWLPGSAEVLSLSEGTGQALRANRCP